MLSQTDPNGSRTYRRAPRCCCSIYNTKLTDQIYARRQMLKFFLIFCKCKTSMLFTISRMSVNTCISFKILAGISVEYRVAKTWCGR